MANASQRKDPRGGLTAAGRAYSRKKEGANLKPGVKRARSAEELKRKGSFLRRMFEHDRGARVDKQGRPTRRALSARAWGEKIPRTKTDQKKLADKGSRLLERYRKTKEQQGGRARRR